MRDQRFSGDDDLFGQEPNDYPRAQAALLPAGGSGLCAADGVGRNSAWLAKQGFKVKAFAISKVGVAKARELGAGPGNALLNDPASSR